jgi:BirA family biotin operon repressor/biotin-[acetyl-CoA-carboxylase] ligase
VLRPLDQRHLLLPLSVPLAVCEAAEELRPGIECKIKWPNDIWVDGRKLAGVLIEAKPQDGWAVIGVGLNLSIAPDEFPPDLRETAVSLFASTPLTPATTLSRHLDRWVAADRGATLAAWRARDALHGREVAWDGGDGVADGIEDSGDLIVVAASGDRVVLGAGEVHLRL